MAEYHRLGMRGRNMNTICRLCLGENVELLHVFELKGIPGWTAANAINELLRIEVSEGDIYPKFICTDCMGRLVDFKLFKHQCEINKDLLDLEYRRHCGVGDNEAVVGMVVCSSDMNTEVYIKQEDLGVPIEKDPLELSDGEEVSIKAEMEESSNGNDRIPSAEVIGSADQIHHPIKCENDQVSSMDGNEIITPDNTSTTEAMQLKQEHPEVNSQCENIVYSDHSMKEEVLDIKSEPFSNGTFEEGTSKVSESELTESINSNAGVTREMTGFIKRRCLSSDVHSIGPENDSRDPIGVSALSSVGGNFGNDEEVPKSIPSSSHTNRVHSSCNSSHNLESERKSVIVSPCHDEHSIVSKYHDQEKIIANEKVFTCVKCSEKFPTPDLLRSHSVIHSGQELFQVPGCSYSIRLKGNIKTITKIDSEKGPFKCLNCSEIFPNGDELKEHLFHSADIPFICNECNMMFYCRNKLKDHVITHYKPFRCTLCSKGFGRKCTLKSHMLLHSGEKLFKCHHCDRSFSIKCNLTTHTRIHTGERPHKCDLCSMTFISSNDLHRHCRTHTSERPYHCNECGKSFLTNYELKSHLRTHAKGRRHLCQQCGKNFASSGDLRKHVIIHLGLRPYKCNHCNASFSQSGSLNTHIMMVHSTVRPFKCNLCPMAFCNNSQLKVHIRTHTGERPYECKQCGKSFATTGAVNKHATTHSREIPSK